MVSPDHRQKCDSPFPKTARHPCKCSVDDDEDDPALLASSSLPDPKLDQHKTSSSQFPPSNGSVEAAVKMVQLPRIQIR